MGVFSQFPYTNFHEMNMDEIIKIVKNMLEEWAQYYNTWDNWKEQVTQEWGEMQSFINNYFDNLNVQTEINNKISDMVISGEFSQIVDPYVPPAVSAWLAQHITTPETIIIDDSLTIAGAAADAKATGDAIFDLESAVFEIREFYNFISAPRETTASFNFDISETLVPPKRYNITVKCDTALDANCAIYLRNSGGNTDYLGDFLLGETIHTFERVVPTEDATMVRFSRAMIGASYTVIVSEIVPLTKKALEDIGILDDEIKTITEKTPITKFGTFQRGNWQNASSFQTTVLYRVACRTDITFNKDVTIACVGAFFLQGYIDGIFFEKVSTINVPKNKPLKLTIRRIWEDSSETADVDEFASTVFVLDYSEASEYNLLSDTFAGIEMFRTAGFIGDSYTAKRLGLSWVDIIGNRTGVQTTRFAKSGDDAGAWITDNANGLPALLNDTAKDLYWIALGINDADRYDNDASYLGSIADISGNYEDYPDTFYGNMGHIIEAIQEHAPSAKIVLYKPLYRAVWRTLGGSSAANSSHMIEIRDAIEDIAEHYSLPFMDAFNDVLFISDWYCKHMDYDIDSGNHPSLLLYPAIASANMRLFSKCVQNNASYFMGMYYPN